MKTTGGAEKNKEVVVYVIVKYLTMTEIKRESFKIEIQKDDVLSQVYKYTETGWPNGKLPSSLEHYRENKT